MRNFSRGLHPQLLTDDGLVPAVEVLVGRSPVPVSLTPGDVPRLEEPIELAAYFVIAEAMTNVLKHAHATAVRIEIAIDGDHLNLTVADDGVGIAGPADGSGCGVCATAWRRSMARSRSRAHPIRGRG